MTQSNPLGMAPIGALRGDAQPPQQVEIVRRAKPADLIGGLVLWAVNSWTTMLAFGGLHSGHAVVPAISYTDAVLGLFLLSIVGIAVRPQPRVWSKKSGGAR